LEINEANNKPSAAEHAATLEVEACNTVDEVDLGLTDILDFKFGLDLDSQNTSQFTSTEKDLGATQLKSVERCELPKRELSTHAKAIKVEHTFTRRASEVKVEFPSPLHRHEHHSRAVKNQASKLSSKLHLHLLIASQAIF
jgi:hypothetical protein